MEEVYARLRMLEQRQMEHENRVDDFMLRTDRRLEILLTQSAQWAGARKALAAVVTLVGLIGGVVGFMTHTFFPTGFVGRP